MCTTLWMQKDKRLWTSTNIVWYYVYFLKLLPASVLASFRSVSRHCFEVRSQKHPMPLMPWGKRNKKKHVETSIGTSYVLGYVYIWYVICNTCFCWGEWRSNNMPPLLDFDTANEVGWEVKNQGCRIQGVTVALVMRSDHSCHIGIPQVVPLGAALDTFSPCRG